MKGLVEEMQRMIANREPAPEPKKPKGMRVFDGEETLTFSELEEKHGVSAPTIYSRYQRGLRGKELVFKGDYFDRCGHSAKKRKQNQGEKAC